MGHHQCLHACQCPTIINNPTYWLSSFSPDWGCCGKLSIVLLRLALPYCAWDEWHGLIKLGYPWTHSTWSVSVVSPPSQAWIKGCGSCVQILTGLARISICVIISLHELSICDKWMLCRPWQGYRPLLTTNPDLMTVIILEYFDNCCSVNSNWEPTVLRVNLARS